MNNLITKSMKQYLVRLVLENNISQQNLVTIIVQLVIKEPQLFVLFHHSIAIIHINDKEKSKYKVL